MAEPRAPQRHHHFETSSVSQIFMTHDFSLRLLTLLTQFNGLFNGGSMASTLCRGTGGGAAGSSELSLLDFFLAWEVHGKSVVTDVRTEIN